MVFEALAKTVEQQANSQENASLLLFVRLSNQNIRKQVIDLLCESEIWEADHGFEFTTSRNADGTIEVDKDGHVLYTKAPHLALSREIIERRYDQTLERVKSLTGIDLTSEEPQGGDEDRIENIPLGWRLPSGEKPNSLQSAIVEAHEKGHSMRDYSSSFFYRHFLMGFNWSIVEFSEDDYREIQKYNAQKGAAYDSPMFFEEQREEFYNYLSSGKEIAERMSQLKNYFGLKGDEQFTLEHLRYAKEHYVKDTGLDNRMTPFFKAITPETEAEFIRLINCSGI